MIPFFRQGSTNYRIPYDAAAGDHTPGTGIWFLASSEYVDWKNGEVLNMMCTGVRKFAGVPSYQTLDLIESGWIAGAGKTVMRYDVLVDYGGVVY